MKKQWHNTLYYSILVWMIFSLVLCFITYKLYNKTQRLETAFEEYKSYSPTAEGLASLYQAYTINGDIGVLDGKEHHVACLGNSITKHEYKDSIGWKSNWGMAASRESKDYCHILEGMMQEVNKNTTVTPISIKSWELDLTKNIDELLKMKLQDKDVIIIRLGENVQDKDLFKSAIIQLVKYCQRKTPYVYITGCFWQDDDKESAIINAASKCHIRYIPLYWLSCLYKEEIYPQEGDTLRDIHGQLYKIQGNFITTHPNDEGMKRIAETIFYNLR